MSIQITPIILNMVCTRAALLAFTLAPIDAKNAVIVVPIFSPKTMAAAVGKVIQPIEAIVMVIAIAALEDCTIIVNKVPININKM